MFGVEICLIRWLFMQRLSQFQCPLEDMRIIKYKNTALDKKESSLSMQSGNLPFF